MPLPHCWPKSTTLAEDQYQSTKVMEAIANQFGTLWGVSVGPGQPDWMTVAARDRLRSVAAIACPQNRQGQPGMAYDIVRRWLDGDRESHQTIAKTEVLALDLPFVREETILEAAWHAAAKQVLAVLHEGKDVAFVAEGDVSFYSTFTYLARAVEQLEPAIAIAPLPGVCSPLAAAATLQIPLSIWDEAVAILPTLHRIDDLERVLDWADVVVLMKVSSVFDRVWEILRDRDLLAHTGMVEWLGWPHQKVYRSLEGLKGYLPPYFAIAIVRVRYPL